MTEPRIYRASSLGYSLEQLVAPHLGFEPIPPPEWLQEKFDEGTALEPIVVEELYQQGWTITDQQEEINLDIIPGVAIVRGHIDGVADANRVIEIKTMNGRTWKEFQIHGWDTPGIIQRYKWQASAYMLGTGMPLELVGWNKEAKNSEQQYTTAWVKEPFYLISDIAQKISEAEKYIADGVIPEGCTDYPCPYFYLHAERVEAEPADTELDELLNTWAEANQKRKAYEAEEKKLRDMIVEYVGQEGKAKVKGSNGVTVSVAWQDAQEVSFQKTAKWVTTVSAPRKGKDA